MTPQVRSMDALRDRGYIVSSVERRKRFPAKGKSPCRACGHVLMVDIAVDLWNFADIIAVHPALKHVALIQTTTQDHHADRKTKIIGSAEAKYCVLAGISVVLMTWAKRQGRWQLREEELHLEDFPAMTPPTIEQKRRPDFPPGHTLPLEILKDEEIPF